MNARHICGLDFGTSNSTLGMIRDDQAQLIPLEGDDVTIPSALFFDFEDHRIHFGRDAITTYMEGGEGRMMRALKSILGTPTIHETTMIGKEREPFTRVLARFLHHMKRTAERQAETELTHVVLGRPVHFVDGNDAADKEAEETMRAIAQDAGFKQIDFEFEPVAAARDFQKTARSEELALIIDIGGGTSDFTILKVSPGDMSPADKTRSILANAGIHIGGTDFDRWLSLRRVMPHLGYGSPMLKAGRLMPVGVYHDLATWQKINFLYNHKTAADLRYLRKESAAPHLLSRLLHLLEMREGHRLALAVEEAKVILSDEGETELSLDFLEQDLRACIRRAHLVDALREGTGKVKQTIIEALGQARVKGEDISVVFLTGGSTKVPHIRNSLTVMTPHARLIDGDAFGSVGIGLALEAQSRFS